MGVEPAFVEDTDDSAEMVDMDLEGSDETFLRDDDGCIIAQGMPLWKKRALVVLVVLGVALGIAAIVQISGVMGGSSDNVATAVNAPTMTSPMGSKTPLCGDDSRVLRTSYIEMTLCGIGGEMTTKQAMAVGDDMVESYNKVVPGCSDNYQRFMMGTSLYGQKAENRDGEECVRAKYGAHASANSMCPTENALFEVMDQEHRRSLLHDGPQGHSHSAILFSNFVRQFKKELSDSVESGGLTGRNVRILEASIASRSEENLVTEADEMQDISADGHATKSPGKGKSKGSETKAPRNTKSPGKGKGDDTKSPGKGKSKGSKTKAPRHTKSPGKGKGDDMCEPSTKSPGKGKGKGGETKAPSLLKSPGKGKGKGSETKAPSLTKSPGKGKGKGGETKVLPPGFALLGLGQGLCADARNEFYDYGGIFYGDGHAFATFEECADACPRENLVGVEDWPHEDSTYCTCRYNDEYLPSYPWNFSQDVYEGKGAVTQPKGFWGAVCYTYTAPEGKGKGKGGKTKAPGHTKSPGKGMSKGGNTKAPGSTKSPGKGKGKGKGCGMSSTPNPSASPTPPSAPSVSPAPTAEPMPTCSPIPDLGEGRNGTIDPENFKVLHCRDGEFGNNESAWTLYFTERGYTNYTFVNGGAYDDCEGICIQCRTLWGCNEPEEPGVEWNFTEFDAVILEQRGVTGCDITPCSGSFAVEMEACAIDWATRYPDRPLVLHNFQEFGIPFFADGFEGILEFEDNLLVEDINVSSVAGGAFDGLPTLNINTGAGFGDGLDSPHVKGSDDPLDTRQAVTNEGGTAITRNGNVWGQGVASSRLVPTDPCEQPIVFEYLERILLCEDCGNYTTF